MRIAYVQNMRLPTEKAHGYQIMKTCEALAQAGVAIRLVVTDRPTPIEQNEFEYYRIERIFELERLHVLDASNKVPTILKSLAFVLDNWYFLRSFKRRFPMDVDAYYTRNPWLAIKLRALTNKPIYLELHAMPRIGIINKLAGLDNVFCVTKWMQNKLHAALPGIRTVLLPDAVDLGVFNPPYSREQARQSLSISEHDGLVVYGGRFATMGEGKGLGVLDQAVAMIANSKCNIKLLLVGGTLQDFQKIEKHPPAQTTACIPSVPRDILAMYYRAADVLVMPFPNLPHYAYEMSPLKLFEYMASGTVIVASDLPSVREILNDQAALFFKPDSLGSMVDTLTRALNDQASSLRIGSEAQEISRRYSWAGRAQTIATTLEDAGCSKA